MGQTVEVILISISRINGVATVGPVTFFVLTGVAFDDYVLSGRDQRRLSRVVLPSTASTGRRSTAVWTRLFTGHPRAFRCHSCKTAGAGIVIPG